MFELLAKAVKKNNNKTLALNGKVLKAPIYSVHEVNNKKKSPDLELHSSVDQDLE